jgi:hypothetical protein
MLAESLQKIVSYFYIGMPKTEIERIIGKSTYAATETEYYYFSQEVD